MRLTDRAGLAVICAALSSAANASGRHYVDIPAGSLGQAAALLGKQANVSIGVSDPRIANLHVRHVAGIMTVSEALAQMIRGLSARVMAVDPSTFVIVAAHSPPQRPARAARRKPAIARLSDATPRITSRNSDAASAEIIVTASKRQSRIEDYPAETAVVAGDELVRGRGLDGTDAIVAKLPIVSSTYLGQGRNKLFIRGIADSSFNGPTQTTAAQFFGEARLNFTAPDPDLQLYDIQRVELIAGPQAGLYGAGSLGGVIRIDPNPPELAEISGTLSIGASGTAHGDPSTDLAASLNLPLDPEAVALRLVGYRSDQGGYIDDLLRKRSNINSVRITGGRASARARFAGWTLDLGGVAQRIRGDDAQFSNQPSNPLTTKNYIPQQYSNNFALASVTVRRERPVVIVAAGSISRQSLREHYDASDIDQRELFRQNTDASVASLEVRASRQLSDHSGWLAGISAVQNDYRQTRSLSRWDALGLKLPGLSNRQSEVAAFAELTRPLFLGIDLTAGARLARSDVSGVVLNSRKSTATEERRQDFFLPSVALSGRPAAALLLYARYQQGFRAGGFSILGDAVQRYRPDRMEAMELGGRYGAKEQSRLRIDASLAYTRWLDIQSDTLDVRGFPATVTAGDGRLYTASAQLTWKPSHFIELESAVVFNDSRITRAAAGFDQMLRPPIPNVAKWNARAAAQFTRPLRGSKKLSMLAALRYVGKSHLGAGPILGREQGGWLEADADGTLSFGHQRLSLSITNLFGVVGNRFAFGSPLTIQQARQITPLRPRTFRIGWDLNF